MTAIYSTQEGVEVLSNEEDESLLAQSTQFLVEVLSANDGTEGVVNYIITTQFNAELISRDSIPGTITQTVVEVLSDFDDYVQPDYPVWPYAADVDFTETKEYLTDVNLAVSKEQRFALRDCPRTTLRYKYLFQTAREYISAAARAAKYVDTMIYVPLWSDGIFLRNINEGMIEIFFDNSFCELKIGSYIIFWENWETWEVGRVALIKSTSILLETAIAISKTSCWLFPLLGGFPSNGINIVSKENHIFTCDLEITCADVYYNSTVPEGVYQSFQDLPIITTATIVTGDITDQLYYNNESVSSDIGQMDQIYLEDYLRRHLAIRMKASTKRELYILRRSFDFLNGKYNAFWVPTFHEDFYLTSSSIPQYVNTITVKYSPAFINLPSSFFIIIIGNISVPIGVSSWQISEDRQTVVLNLIKEHVYESFAIKVAINNIKMISLIHKSRLDSDSIEFKHENHGFTMVYSPTVSVDE